MRWFRRAERKPESQNARELIARRQYPQALELLRARLQRKPGDRRLRLELAEALIVSGQVPLAVEELLDLADDLVRQRFMGQARVVLKRAQDLEPGRSDIEERLDALDQIQKAAERPRPAAAPEAPEARAASEPGASLAPPPGVEALHAPDVGSVPDGGEPQARVAETEHRAPLPSDAAGDDRTAAIAAPDDDEMEIPLDDVLDSLDASPAMDGHAADTERQAPSRLLGALPPEAAAALLTELRPLTCEPGEILITEGEQAHSLLLIESGSVLVFVKNKAGRSVKVSALEAGDFFGEIAALTGTRRTATVTAATHCRLLVADKAMVESLVSSHPQVRQLLVQSFEQRVGDEHASAVRGKRLRRRMPSDRKRRRTAKRSP